MKGKILLVVGIGVGYVLGARAGRERYEEIKQAAQKLWSDPRVQKQMSQAEGFVKDKAPDVAEFLSDGAKKVVSQVSGRQASGSKKPAARAASKPAAKSASKPAARAGSTTRSSTTKK
ncbi:MAG TPA: YtxH domain-containing protein [Galbitalea sp.]